jgi:hypothetical protein
VLFVNIPPGFIAARGTLLRGLVLIGALDDLVQLAAIEPHTPALGAIVNLDTLPVRHDQIRLQAYRTFHRMLPQIPAYTFVPC